MTIKNIKKKLETSSNPVAEAIHQNANFRVIAFAFKKGMNIKEHKAYHPSKFIVFEGSVIYKEKDRVIEMGQYDEVDIPSEMPHSVEALEDSLCILTQGKE
ncbi:MAG: hypothetical protein WC967_13040 [Balneolaceae bacterium]